jgi:hypothetical protein
MMLSGAAGAAALGAAGIENSPPPVNLEPAKPAPPAAAAQPPPAPVQIPVVVAPPPIKPAGIYALTYDLDRNVGISGHNLVSERGMWLWSLKGSYSSGDERLVGDTRHVTTEETTTRVALSTGYRRLLGTGPTRTFVDSILEIGYEDRSGKMHSNADVPETDVKYSERDTYAAVSVLMGFEYFFSPVLSVEGSAGLTVTYVDRGGRYADYEASYLLERSGHETIVDFFDAGLRVNYYW